MKQIFMLLKSHRPPYGISRQLLLRKGGGEGGWDGTECLEKMESDLDRDGDEYENTNNDCGTATSSLSDLYSLLRE